MLAFLLVLLATPFLILLGALFRGVILCIPVALVTGWVHNRLGFVPDLDVVTSFFVVALLSLLVPAGNSGLNVNK